MGKKGGMKCVISKREGGGINLVLFLGSLAMENGVDFVSRHSHTHIVSCLSFRSFLPPFIYMKICLHNPSGLCMFSLKEVGMKDEGEGWDLSGVFASPF